MASQQTIEFPPKNAASSTNVETDPVWNTKAYGASNKPFVVDDVQVLVVMADKARLRIENRQTGAALADEIFHDLVGLGPHVTAIVGKGIPANEEVLVKIAIQGGKLPGGVGLITAFIGVTDAA